MTFVGIKRKETEKMIIRRGKPEETECSGGRLDSYVETRKGVTPLGIESTVLKGAMRIETIKTVFSNATSVV